MSEEMIRYQSGASDTWFIQYVSDPLPTWAINIEPYDPELNMYTYTVEEWLDDMAEISGVGRYDENGEWQWSDE